MHISFFCYITEVITECEIEWPIIFGFIFLLITNMQCVLKIQGACNIIENLKVTQ
jgi:hypothetical protein